MEEVWCWAVRSGSSDARGSLFVSRKAGDLSFFVFAFRFLGQQRTAELNLAEAEAVAQQIRRFAQPFQPGPPLGIEQIELFLAMRQPAEGHAEQTNFAAAIAVLAKQGKKMRERIAVKLHGTRRRLGPRIGIEARVADGQG